MNQLLNSVVTVQKGKPPNFRHLLVSWHCIPVTERRAWASTLMLPSGCSTLHRYTPPSDSCMSSINRLLSPTIVTLLPLTSAPRIMNRNPQNSLKIQLPTYGVLYWYIQYFHNLYYRRRFLFTWFAKELYSHEIISLSSIPASLQYCGYAEQKSWETIGKWTCKSHFSQLNTFRNNGASNSDRRSLGLANV